MSRIVTPRGDCMGVRSPCRLRSVRKRDCKGLCALRPKDDFVEPPAPARTLVDIELPVKTVAVGGMVALAAIVAAFAAKRARR